jgi:putative membrane protein
MDWYGNGWGFGSGMGMLVMLISWGGLTILAVWAMSRLTRGDSQHTLLESPRQILDRRFAKGEIGAEQYAESRHILEARTAVTPTPRS